MAPRTSSLYYVLIIALLIDSGEGANIKLSLGFSALSPPEVIILRNHPLLLNCSGFSEEGPLQIFWKYQDVTIRDKHYQLLSNGSLFVERTFSSKKKERRWDGNYTCMLKNRVGSLASVPVRVLFARMSKLFTYEPQPLTAYEGGQARFTCQINAVPPADITWYKDGVNLPQNDSRYSSLPSGTLQITGLKPSDAGNYKCRCANIAKQRDSSEAELIVEPRVEEFRTPTFMSTGEEVTAIADEPAVLECLADGFPPVELSWSREDGIEIPDQLVRGGNLYFPSVQLFHAGSYICAAKVLNKETKQIHTAIKKVLLTVLVPPKFSKVPVSQIIPTSQTVRFDCEVESSPAASIRWLKDGEHVYINGRIKLKPGNTLVVSQTVTSDSGIYQCVASNSAGVVTSAARLQVNASSDQPQPPSGLKAFTMSSSAIMLSWDAVVSSPSAPIQAYTVHYVPSNGGLEQDAVAVNTSLLIERLKPFTNYTFYVRAYSNKSASEPSQPIVQMTGEDVPFVAPKITLSSISPTTLHVQWDELPLSKSRGVVTGHRIYYRKHKQASHTVRSSNTATEYTITGLTPKQKYDVRVLSGTKAGYPSSLNDEQWPWVVYEMPAVSSSKVPYSPIVHLTVQNNTALEVGWSMPTDNPYPVNGYYLSYRQPNKPLKHRITLPANATKFLLYDLAPQSWYEVYLVAFNKKGESRESVRKIITSSGDNPDAETVEVVEPPHQLEAEPTSSMTIRLTWKAPETSRNISYYTVRYHPVFASGLVNESYIYYIRSTNTEVVIDNLQPFTMYEFAVRSHDVDKRQGPFSPTVECKTKEALPSVPEDLTWSPVDANSIRLNWQAPKFPNGVITAYWVLYSTKNTKSLDSWSYKEEKGTETTTLLTGLASNTLYYLRMKAKNGAGMSTTTQTLHVNIPVRHNNTKPPSQENFNTQSSEQYLGMVIGGLIGLTCLILCIIIIKCRNRCCPSPAAAAPGPDGRYSAHRGNGYIPQQNGHVGAQNAEKRASNIESQEMECFTPMLHYPNGSNDRHLDTKGGYGLCNGRSVIPPQIIRNSHSSSSSHQDLVGTNSQPSSAEAPVSKNSKRYSTTDRKADRHEEACDVTSSTILLDEDPPPADSSTVPSSSDDPFSVNAFPSPAPRCATLLEPT